MNKKGFTLIELLAVIVILAVIALIATPVVMNSINNARRGAAENAGYGVVKAIEHQIALNVLADESYQANASQLNALTGVNIQGTAPTTPMSLTFSENAVSGGTMVVNGYGLIVCDNGRIVSSNNATPPTDCN